MRRLVEKVVVVVVVRDSDSGDGGGAGIEGVVLVIDERKWW